MLPKASYFLNFQNIFTMKKNTFIFVVFSLVCIAVVQAQSQPGIIDNALKKSAEHKVAEMQELIGFDDAKANRLIELEFQFLLDVRKAENCCLCNKRKRIEKLQKNRDKDLQNILSREQYIKYDAVENDRIKNIPVHL